MVLSSEIVYTHTSYTRRARQISQKYRKYQKYLGSEVEIRANLLRLCRAGDAPTKETLVATFFVNTKFKGLVFGTLQWR